jgi:hypothetical protein
MMPFFRNATNPSQNPSFERVHLPKGHIDVQYDTVFREVTLNSVAQEVSMLTVSIADVASYKPRPPAPQPSAATSNPAEISSPTEAGFTAFAATAIAAAAAHVSTVSELQPPSDSSITSGKLVATGRIAVGIKHQVFRCDDKPCSDKQIDKSTQIESDIAVQGPEYSSSGTDSDGKLLEEAVEGSVAVGGKSTKSNKN